MGASPGTEETGGAHLLEEPEVEDGERAVQQVEEGEEPAFVQRLAGRTRRGRAVSLPPAGERSEALPEGTTQTSWTPGEASRRTGKSSDSEGRCWTRAGLSEAG